MPKKRIKDSPEQIRLDFSQSPVPSPAMMVPVLSVRKHELLLVDGLNVINVMKDVGRRGNLELLLALLVELKNAGGNFCCIFDANTPFELSNYSGEKVKQVSAVPSRALGHSPRYTIAVRLRTIDRGSPNFYC